jgi:DNA-binding MarR family transcriptional regulator
MAIIRYRYETDDHGRSLRRIMRRSERANEFGGSGSVPTYDGRAGENPFHYALTGKTRLMILTHLAAHGRSSVPEMTTLYGWRRDKIKEILPAFQRAHLVERVIGRRPAAWCHRNTWRNPPCWEITDVGRRWLWRYGWIMRRLWPICPYDLETPLRHDTPEAPVLALEQGAHRDLLRPAAVAVTMEIMIWGPCTRKEMQQSLEMQPTSANYHLDRFRKNGWAESFRRPPQRRYERVVVRWRFTPEGKTAVERHVDAIRRAATASGYFPTKEDLDYPFGENGVESVTRFA